MAVTGSNRILWSATTGNAPASLLEGQLAVNIPDRRLFFRNPAGAVESMRLEEAFYRNASNLNAGAIPDARLTGSYTGLTDLTGSGVLNFAGGIIAGSLNGYPVWEGMIDFGGDVANTWRRIVNVVSPVGGYRTIGFKIEIVDPQWSHALLIATDNVIAETYYVACARTEDVVQDTPDACSVRGPGSRVRAVKTATGSYQIQIQNLAQYREYRVRVSVVTVNGTHAVTYHAGDAASAGTVQYAASVGNARDDFQNIRVYNSLTNGSGQTYWHQGNDGAGSGLDADTLDGQQGSFYQNAGNLSAGTLTDARLPTRLGTTAKSITDWNLALENGWYMGSNILNQPVPGGGWFAGVVDAHFSTYVTQTVHRFAIDGPASAEVYRRSLDNGTWTAWYRLRWSEAELDARYITTSSPNLTGTPAVDASPIWHDGNTPGAPAYIKDAAIRPREAWDNATFRAAVKAGNDASNGLEEVISQTGRVRLPDQGENIKINRRIEMGATGVRLEGTRLGTRVYLNAANAGIDINGRYHCEVDGMTFLGGRKGGSVVPTGGAVIALNRGGGIGCHDPQLRNITFDGVYNAVDAYNVNKFICEDMYIRDIYGTAGIKVYGGSDSQRSDLFYFNRIVVDNPPNENFDAGDLLGAVNPNGSGGWFPYVLNGTVISYNSRFYQCVSDVPVTPNPYPHIDTFPDGNTSGALVRDDFDLVWLRLFRTSLAGVLQDSFANSLEADSLIALNVPYGFRMLDSIGTSNSYPQWAYLDNCDFEHNYYNGILLSGGVGFKSTLGYVGASKSGAGIYVTSGWKGQGSFADGEIRLCAQQGALIAAPFAVNTTEFISNGQAGAGLYDQLLVGSGTDNVQIVANQFKPAVWETGTMAARRPIAVQSGTSNNLMITNNLAWGHATSNAVLNSSTGTNQIVANNS